LVTGFDWKLDCRGVESLTLRSTGFAEAEWSSYLAGDFKPFQANPLFLSCNINLHKIFNDSQPGKRILLMLDCVICAKILILVKNSYTVRM